MLTRAASPVLRPSLALGCGVPHASYAIGEAAAVRGLIRGIWGTIGVKRRADDILPL